jgi:hypothetical protein
VGYTVSRVRGWRPSELGDAATKLETTNSAFETALNDALAVALALHQSSQGTTAESAWATPEDARQELADATARWGILRSKVATWTSIANEAGDRKEKWNLGTGVGPTGLVVTMNASIKNGVQVFNTSSYWIPNTTPPKTSNRFEQPATSACKS